MNAELFDKGQASYDHWSRENADQLIKWNAVSDGKKNPVSIWNGKEYLVCLGRISDQVLLPPASPSLQLGGCSDRRLGISSTSLFAHKIWRRYIASGPISFPSECTYWSIQVKILIMNYVNSLLICYFLLFYNSLFYSLWMKLQNSRNPKSFSLAFTFLYCKK